MARGFDFDVVVAGGGPVGLVTGLALARRGLKTAVLEEQWRPAARSYGLALHPASARLLAELGVESTVLGRANLVQQQTFYGGGRIKAELSFGVLDEHGYVLVLPQSQLEEILAEAVTEAGGRVFWSHRLRFFRQDASGVDLEVDQLVKETAGYSVSRTEWVVKRTLAWRVPFLVGADGHRSLVRRTLGIGFPEVGPVSTFAVFEFGSTSETRKELSVVLEPDSVSVLWPLTGGRMRWSFELPDFESSTDPRLKSRLFVHYRDAAFPYVVEDKFAELVNERAPWFHVHVAEMYWSAIVRFERRLADEFGGGRVWLLGDAVHLALPVAIQSMNLGFLEAADLAERLEAVCKGRSTPAALEEYGQVWRQRWRDLLDRVSQAEAAPDASEWVRENAPRIVALIPASGLDLEKLAAGLGIRL